MAVNYSSSKAVHDHGEPFFSRISPYDTYVYTRQLYTPKSLNFSHFQFLPNVSSYSAGVSDDVKCSHNHMILVF